MGTPFPGIQLMQEEANPTRNSHFNPAFWIALWNEDYFAGRAKGRAREQRIHALSFKANKVFPTKVEKVHVRMGSTLAPLKSDDLIEWGKANLDETTFKSLASQLQGGRELLLSEEPVLNVLEDSPACIETLSIIKRGNITSAQEKLQVSAFVLLQASRHPKSMFNLAAQSRGWQGLLELRRHFSNPQWIAQMLEPLHEAHWNLHTATEHTFPLPDDPVLVNEAGNRIWAVLSPRLLLEICIDQRAPDICRSRRFDVARDRAVYRNFRRLAIQEATTEIVSHDPARLHEWHATPEFRERRSELADLESHR